MTKPEPREMTIGEIINLLYVAPPPHARILTRKEAIILATRHERRAVLLGKIELVSKLDQEEGLWLSGPNIEAWLSELKTELGGMEDE